MDTTQSSQFNANFQNHKGNLSEINYSTILFASNGLNDIPAKQREYLNHFLGKKRGGVNEEFAVQGQEYKDQGKCFLCFGSTQSSKLATCQRCEKNFHLTCLNGVDQILFFQFGPNRFTCNQCRVKGQQIPQSNKNYYEYNEDLYGLYMGYPFANGGNAGNEDQYKMPFLSNGRMTEKQLYQNISANNAKTYMNAILATVMTNKSLNNEQRLNYILKNANYQLNLHPLIVKVLKDRENGYYMRNAGIDPQMKEMRKKQQNAAASAANQAQMNVQKFPIEDKLLFEGSNDYDIDKEIWNRPQGEKIEIEFNLCNKAIIAWDFLVTFNESLLYEDIQFELRTNFDLFYTDIILGEKSDELYQRIIIAICHLLVKHLKVFDLSNNNKEVYIIKTLIDNSNSPAGETFSHCLIEVLRIITSCSTYVALCNEAFTSVLKKVLLDKSFSLMSPGEKILFLHGLVNLAYETHMIKSTVRSEFDKRVSLSNEKTVLEENLRNTEKRKKEITRGDSFDTLTHQIKDLTTQLEEINNRTASPLSSEDKKKISEIEKKIQINQSHLKENVTLEERRVELTEKIQKIKDVLLALKVPRKKFLGQDYLNDEYYYFNCSVGKLYIKSKANQQWSLMSKKEDIEVLSKKLTDKGIKERELKSYIKRILHEMGQKESKDKDLKDSNNKDENDKGDQGTEIDSDKAKIELLTVINDNEKTVTDNMNIDDIAKTSIASILIKMERKFSEYLKQFNKEWECPEMREKWKSILLETDNEANFISTLKMFNHRFKNPYKSDIEENDEDEEMHFEIPEAAEKFVFYDDEGNEELVISETDPNKVLSPKVKIWPKEVELNGVDEYYTNELLSVLCNEKDKGKLLLALHFYEDVIFGLIKRRENKKISHTVMTNLLPVELAKR